MIKLLFSWEDYYSKSDSSLKTNKNEKYNSIQITTTGSHFVFRCYFIDCSSQKGGAIQISSETKLLIEETVFSFCLATSGNGGSINFEGSGACVIIKSCCFRCKASYLGPFIYVKYPDSLDSYCTVCDCASSYSIISSGNEEISLYKGVIHISYINSSYNKCKLFSGIYVNSATASDYSNCSITFSCCANTNELDYSTICCSGDGKACLKSCNVVNNTQWKNDYGAIYGYCYISIHDVCVVGNNASYSISARKSANVYNTIYDKLIDSNVEIKTTASYTFANQLSFLRNSDCYEYINRDACTHRIMIHGAFNILSISCMILLSN